MKTTLVTLLCLIGTAGTTQDARAQTISSPNTAFLKHLDGVTGSFPYMLNDREQMQITYRLRPLNPGKKTHFMIHSPEPMPVHAIITNNKGKVVYTWKPEQVLHHYDVSWDMSALKNGAYTINLQLGDDKKNLHQIAFTH